MQWIALFSQWNIRSGCQVKNRQFLIATNTALLDIRGSYEFVNRLSQAYIHKIFLREIAVSCVEFTYAFTTFTDTN